MLRPKVFDLNGLIEGMRPMLVSLAGPLVEVATDLGAGSVRVRADATQIEQVILNLTVNARDAMPAGGRLAVRTRVEPAGEEKRGGPSVVLEVTDSGHGIEAATLPQIFDPFFSTKPGGRGAGLGLATVYGIVKQSGGHIAARSVTVDESDAETPSGTTFSIRLPIVVDEAAAPSSPRPSPTQPLHGTETIALVEDEKSVRDLAERILAKNGYRVIKAGNGREAIAAIGRFSERIDMLVTDVVMPGMNGSELADRIAVMRPGVKVLFVSGYTQDAIGNKGVIGDEIAFLEKPFAPDALLRKVREVLDG
jgi:CheY-like chemotaxis protein